MSLTVYRVNFKILAIQVLVHLAIQPRERMIYLYEENEYQISFEEAVMLDGRDYGDYRCGAGLCSRW